MAVKKQVHRHTMSISCRPTTDLVTTCKPFGTLGCVIERVVFGEDQ
jgi:hypothetical protein